MTKTSTIVWCIAIGALTGIYGAVWANLPTVQNYMWIGFISLPIYFCSGAAPKLFPQHAVCAVCGVLWGVVTLVILEMGLIPGSNMNLFIVLMVVVGLCCVVHMVILPPSVLGGIFSSAPMVFGGYSAIFSQGMGQAVGVTATLLGGLCLGVVINGCGIVLTKTLCTREKRVPRMKHGE
ncbi:MAG: DUF1097 domain-containing protein [Planctomycetaceae bacterium]|nr:DUF1097 domain-containing protein [Planctomycetaceae bacterium]